MAADAGVLVLSDDVVTLRPWNRADAAFLARASADPDIQRYNSDLDHLGNPPPPLTLASAEAVIDSFTSAWEAFSSAGTPSVVVFAITDARSGEVVGCCGLDDWSKHDVVQFGYWLAASGRGRGLATRAVVLLTRWLFEVGAARVFLTVVADNQTSAAVARRAGFVHEGTMRSQAVWQGGRLDVMWFAALPLEWAPAAFSSPAEPT